MLSPRSLLMMLLAAGLPGNKLGKSLPVAFESVIISRDLKLFLWP